MALDGGGNVMKRPLWISTLRHGTAALAVWEAVAIELDHPRMPTLSRLAGDHRWVGPTLVIALVIHLLWPFPGQPEPALLESIS